MLTEPNEASRGTSGPPNKEKVLKPALHIQENRILDDIRSLLESGSIKGNAGAHSTVPVARRVKK